MYYAERQDHRLRHMSNASGHSTAFNAGIRIDVESNWECPSCGRQHVSKASLNSVQTPMHACGALAGAWVPFVQAGTKAHHRLQEREDYVGTDTPFVDANGRVIMSVYTTRDDGEDCHILASTANVNVQAS
jgi:hypothetical protein